MPFDVFGKKPTAIHMSCFMVDTTIVVASWKSFRGAVRTISYQWPPPLDLIYVSCMRSAYWLCYH